MSNQAGERNKLPPTTRMGVVSLNVSRLERSLAFYREMLGLELMQRDDDTALLGVDQPLLLLTEQPAAKFRSPDASGLYHVAFLVPGRADLACFLRHLLDVGYALREASDHVVSEALYLSDLDGNGIEVYRDRPRGAWPWQNGRLYAANSSDPLDKENLLAELEGNGPRWRGMPAGTCIGHVHLQAADLDRAVAFYQDILGFEESITGIAGAYFMAAGGYHHHLALNTWHSLGGPPPPSDAIGLRFFTICLPDKEGVKGVAGRLEAADVAFRHISDPDALVLRDREGNGLLLVAGQFSNQKEVMSLAKLSIKL